MKKGIEMTRNQCAGENPKGRPRAVLPGLRRLLGLLGRICLLSLAFLSGLALASSAQAEDAKATQTDERCIVTASVCVEAGGTRIVDGIAVTRDCWATRDTYTCITPVAANDDGQNSNDATVTDGCATLVSESEGLNTAHCTRTEAACDEMVTGVDGESVCVREKENWACESQIKLPAVNAQWTGTTTAVDEVVDESACKELEENESCVKGELACTEEGCTRTYQCGGRQVHGCSILIDAGCTSIREPACDPAVDSDCDILLGEVSCKGDLPEGVIDSGAAEIEGSTTVNVGLPKPDATACTDLETSNTTCTQVSQTCVDRYPTYRVINGKGYSMPCWGYERVMQCTTTNPENTCTALANEPECSETARTCAETDAAGECIAWSVTYSCRGAAEDVEGGAAEVVGEDTEISGVVEVSTCEELKDNPVCRLESSRCLEGPATKIVDGVPVYKDCWKTEATYVCGSGDGNAVTEDDCKELAADASCKRTESVCLGTNDTGECTMRTDTYICGGGSEEIVAGEVCDGELCIAGLCEPGASEPGKTEDFLNGITLMEIIRQAGVYGEADRDSLFGGTASSCTVKAAGFSCCRTENAETASSMDNSAFGVALTTGIDAGWEMIKWAGSPYVYDILSEYEATSGLLTALYGDAASGVYSPTFSYYGVSVSAGANGSLVLEFSPLSFMAAVAMDMAADYFSCTDADRMHVLRESRGLCHYVGSFCDKTSGLGCLEKKESWVCFNSKLALLVQEQGRKQLGLGWGSPSAPLARGFTLAEFQKLDFSRMDLSAIAADIAVEAAKNGLTIDADAIISRGHKRVETIAAGGDQYVEFETFTGKCAATGGCTAGTRYVLSGYAKLSDIAEAAAPERSSRRSVTSLLLEKKGKRGEEAEREVSQEGQGAMSSSREAGRSRKSTPAGQAKLAK